MGKVTSILEKVGGATSDDALKAGKGAGATAGGFSLLGFTFGGDKQRKSITNNIGKLLIILVVVAVVADNLTGGIL